MPVYPPGTEIAEIPPILVNIGDLMQFWTNGLLRSTVHRVVFPEGQREDRYSIAYFCHPLDHVEIETVPSKMVNARNPGNNTRKSITADEYLKQRLVETYGWNKKGY